MLIIRSEQIDALIKSQYNSMTAKIDKWLSNNCEDYKEIEHDRRFPLLESIIEKGKTSGMETESDYALFARVLITKNSPLQLLDEQADIAELLNDESIKPEGKLVRLVDLLPDKRSA